MKKDQFLKIAKVKNLDEFYRKYPTEESFMAKHGKALKKAQIGSYIGGVKDPSFQLASFKDIYDQADYAITGSTQDERNEAALRRAELAAAQQANKAGGGGGLGNLGGMLQQLPQMLGEGGGGGEGMGKVAAALGGAKKGKKIKKAQVGATTGQINQMSQMQANLVGQQVGRATASSMQPITNPAKPTPNPALEIEEIQSPDFVDQIAKYAGPTGKIIQGIQQLKDEKQARKRAEQARDVSKLALQASRIRPEQTQRRYVRPEDIQNTGEEFFPIYGVGTNVLARNGKMIGGIPGEISNTYAPNTLYDDLGYEPLNDSERYKQFMHGGKMHIAQDGFLAQLESAGGGQAGSQLITSIGGENAGGNIGGEIGAVAGSFLGPGGAMVGRMAGQTIGTLLNKNPRKTERAQRETQKNIQNMALQQGIQGGQAQYSSFMKDGGEVGDEYKWVSHTWQPQKLVYFGEHKLSDLLKPPHDADMLRAGGHLKSYTPPSERAMSTERPMMEMGGELQTHWGGYAEPMSYNPYLPDGGETIMFRGQSHEESDGKGNTGIGITYGQSPVEVERGEPAIKMKDGSGSDSSLVVFGNLKIPHGLLGDPKAKGKNFKRYVSELSETENKSNKLVNKSVNQLDSFDVQTPIDRLTFNALQANIMGSNMKLKDIAQKKMDASALQTAMNDTVEEYGLKTTDKGNIIAKLGASIQKAQDGTKKPSRTSAMETVPLGQKESQYGFGKVTAQDFETLKQNNPWYNWKGFNPKKKTDVIKFQESFNNLSKALGSSAKLEEDGLLGEQTVTARVDYDGTPVTTEKTQMDEIVITGKKKGEPKKEEPKKEEVKTEETKTEKKPNLMNYINQVLPYLRPSDVEELDPNQLMGEMLALSQNQLEPVRAQLFQPELSVPFDISLQDILNENEATFRAQQRLIGYNPAFQSQLNAQKYAANQKVLGEQFRMNQAMKDQIYRENRSILNESKLQNLGILDQQYARQEEAKSKTKATTQAALNSIASKYAQNKLENRTLQVYENMYNYRFDPRFRAVNMNPLVDFQSMVANASPSQIAEFQKVLETKTQKGTKTDEKKARNGSIVKALKNI